jgi:hypothetical protein
MRLLDDAAATRAPGARAPSPAREPGERDRDPHLHLYGALTPAQSLDLTQGHPVDWGWLAGRWREAGLTPPDFATLARRHRAGEPVLAALTIEASGFASFQARYDLVIACSRWASGRHDRWSGDTAAEVTQVCALVAREHGPAEARVLVPGTATDAWVEPALDHLASAAAAHGLHLALSLPRAQPLRHWPLVAAAAARHACITGIDLCGIEDEPSAHAPLAAAIAAWNRQHGRSLALLVHVGEQLRGVQPLSAVRRVWDAVALGADRLGHALAVRLAPSAWPATPVWERTDERRARLAWLQWQAADLGLDAEAIDNQLAALADRDPAAQLAAEPSDPGLLRACQEAVLARIRQAGRTIEICPTSNCVVSGAPLASHGIERLGAAGVAWVVGSDDPGILGTTWAKEVALTSGTAAPTDHTAER